MRIRTVKFFTYGTFVIAAFIILLAMVLPIPSNFIVVVMYIGGAIGILGMIFCLRSLWYTLCPKCREFMIIKKEHPEFCPCCNAKWLLDE